MKHKTCAVLSLLTGRFVPYDEEDTGKGMRYLIGLMSHIAGAPVMSHMLAARAFTEALRSRCETVISADIVDFARRVKPMDRQQFMDAVSRFCANMPECEVGGSPAMSDAEVEAAFWQPLAGKTLVVLEGG